MKCKQIRDKLAKAVAVVMVVAALSVMAVSFMPSTVLAATSGDNCVTGLCCIKGASWKCVWIPYWRFKYNPVTMACC